MSLSVCLSVSIWHRQACRLVRSQVQPGGKAGTAQPSHSTKQKTGCAGVLFENVKVFLMENLRVHLLCVCFFISPKGGNTGKSPSKHLLLVVM